jgi:hypothetical protein
VVMIAQNLAQIAHLNAQVRIHNSRAPLHVHKTLWSPPV